MNKFAFASKFVSNHSLAVVVFALVGNDLVRNAVKEWKNVSV